MRTSEYINELVQLASRRSIMEPDFCVLRLHPAAIIPRRGTRYSVGYDLFATDSLTVQPHSSLLVDTGVSLILPYGYFAKVESRSGLSVRHLLFTAAGVIDADYTGELKVLLVNHSDRIVNVPYGKACAQLILVRAFFDPYQLQPHEISDPEEYVKMHELRYPDNRRRECGFGSTDKVTPV